MNEGASTQTQAQVLVKFSDHKWHTVKLVQRMEGTNPPRWKVQWDCGDDIHPLGYVSQKDDIWLGAGDWHVQFPHDYLGPRVATRSLGNKEWRPGRIVYIDSNTGGKFDHSTSDAACLLYDDGGWEEGWRFGNPDLKFLLWEPKKDPHPVLGGIEYSQPALGSVEYSQPALGGVEYSQPSLGRIKLDVVYGTPSPILVYAQPVENQNTESQYALGIHDIEPVIQGTNLGNAIDDVFDSLFSD